MTINLADNNPRINYSVASGVTQTVFSVPFDFFEDSDVSIYVDGTLKVEGTDYTLTGGDGATGTLTFVTATPPNVQQVTGISGGTTVSIVRHVALKRVTDFATGQNINRTSLNEQLDTIVAQVADLDSKVDRTIHLTDSELAPSMLLTSDRKGRVLAFDSTTGDVEAGPLSNDINTIATNITEILDASNQAAAAAASATAAASSATAAQTAETNAETAETNAETAETNSQTSATNSAASANAALGSQNAASSSAAAALASQVDANTSQGNASVSALAASNSETAAALSETNAATSATNAATSETNAATSATASSGSATASAASATAAATSETNAAASETAAGTSETNAAASASTASTGATTATTKAGEASTSATNAATSATSAQASKDAALAALDSFDDRYLGQKATDPTLDNDGDALVAGALYFNTSDDVMKVYEGSSWVAAYASLSGALLQANNLSDLADAAAARTNLGLGTAAATASTDYATAAQGTLADSAVQPNDNPTFAGLTTTANVSFGDNDKAIFGAGSDLQIYHDGSNSYIKDAGTGNLRIQGSDITLQDADGNGFISMIDGGTGGTVYIKHSGSDVLATTSTGVSITGALTLSGTVDGRDVAADGTKLDGIEAGATSDQTAAQLLTAIKTVDGAGSGLDADTLDGLDESTFMRRSANSGLDMNNNNITDVEDIYLQDKIYHDGDTNTYIQFHAADQWRVVTGGAERFEVNNSQITSTEPIHAPSFHGDGSSLTGIAAGAGGGGSDEIFWENGQNVTSNYTITNGKNAMSAGPITINSGVTVTVGAGETWTVV